MMILRKENQRLNARRVGCTSNGINLTNNAMSATLTRLFGGEDQDWSNIAATSVGQSLGNGIVQGLSRPTPQRLPEEAYLQALNGVNDPRGSILENPYADNGGLDLLPLGDNGAPFDINDPFELSWIDASLASGELALAKAELSLLETQHSLSQAYALGATGDAILSEVLTTSPTDFRLSYQEPFSLFDSAGQGFVDNLPFITAGNGAIEGAAGDIVRATAQARVLQEAGRFIHTDGIERSLKFFGNQHPGFTAVEVATSKAAQWDDALTNVQAKNTASWLSRFGTGLTVTSMLLDANYAFISTDPTQQISVERFTFRTIGNVSSWGVGSLINPYAGAVAGITFYGAEVLYDTGVEAARNEEIHSIDGFFDRLYDYLSHGFYKGN